MAKGGGGKAGQTIKEIAEKALRDAKKATSKAASKTASSSREARKAANKAEAASSRAAKTEASKQAREARRGWNQRNYKQVTDTAVSQRYGTGEFKLSKAKENFATDVERFNRVIEATDKELRRGVDSPQLEKKIREAKKYAESAVDARGKSTPYVLDESDIKAIIKDHRREARQANMTAKRNLKKVMRKYAEIEKEGGQKALVDEGARRGLRRESKGQSLVKEVGDDRFMKEREVNKRLEKLDRDRKDKKRLSQATSKMRGSSGPRKKTTKKVEETKSNKKLRTQQDENAKRIVPKTEQGRKALAQMDKDYNRGKITLERYNELRRGIPKMEGNRNPAEGSRLRSLRERDITARSTKKPAPKMGNVKGASGPTGKRKINIRPKFGSSTAKPVKKAAKRK
jgi:hypothetical protein